MKKISIRAIEIMVNRHRGTIGPSGGYNSMHDYYTRTDSKYPNLSYLEPQDTVLAIDEFQDQNEKHIFSMDSDISNCEDVVGIRKSRL